MVTLQDSIRFTVADTELMRLLATRHQVSRTEISDRLYPDTGADDDTIGQAVRRLRAKLEHYGIEIATRHGFGFGVTPRGAAKIGALLQAVVQPAPKPAARAEPEKPLFDPRIGVLRGKGWSDVSIARHLGIDIRTVRTALGLPQPEGVAAPLPLPQRKHIAREVIQPVPMKPEEIAARQRTVIRGLIDEGNSVHAVMQRLKVTWAEVHAALGEGKVSA